MELILIHYKESEFYTLYWNIPLTAKEKTKIFDTLKIEHELIEELNFEPYIIPHKLCVVWLTPIGIQEYRKIVDNITGMNQRHYNI